MVLSIMVLPTIEICLASPPITPVEPYSPIPPVPVSNQEEEGLRSSLLSPPKHLSPLCPADVPLKGQGLERERFEVLLLASRERSKALGDRKEPSLRKELAQKNHISKQAARRNRFLQKLQEPPSLAINDPETPPESPAILNYSLPSPKLISPLAMYEQLEEECATPEPWVEQVDYRIRVSTEEKKSSPTVADKVRATLFKRSTPTKGLPSLDQISARMNMRRAAPESKPSVIEPCSQSRLSVGRIQLPPRSPAPQKEKAYASPTSPTSPSLQVITTIVPSMFTGEKKNLTRSNVEAFSRDNMLKTLRRRSEVGTQVKFDLTCEIRDLRRRSAHAELPKRERQDFKHPVLNLRGAF